MRKYWFTLATFLSALYYAPCFCQTTGNMVFNPSFEEHNTCPKRIEAMGVMTEADAWWQPTGGSSDYFNSCGGRECSVPRNKLGYQVAHSGEAYCGIYCSQEHYREYLQTELKSPLVAGKRYRVSFWVSIADKSPHAVATLSALLTRQRAEDTARGILMNREKSELGEHESQSIAIYYTPQVTHDQSHPLDNNRHWEEVSGEFVAEGGEQFLTIGNFLPFNKSNVVPTGVNSPLQGAYYYIDDVSLFCLDSIDEEKPNTLPEVGKVVRLENLYFATGESTVLQQSYKELHALLTLLSENPSIHIELRGHTDNQGTIEYNQKLSEKRAKAVADYLVKRGIERNRINWVGFGKSAPVATNDTPEGRRQNRRVEYVVIAR